MSEQFKKVSIIGLGYIGLPTAAILASSGVKVVGVDINKDAVNIINAGNVHIVEPELDVLVRNAVKTGMLKATTTVEESDVFLIAVPTPFMDGHKPDLSYVKAAVESIAPVLKKNNLIILESTCPVGTTGNISRWMSALRDDLSFPKSSDDFPDVNIAYCPERVLPGRILYELVNNDRVIGGLTSECSNRAEIFYKTFITGQCLLTDSRTAEMCKLTENSFRDVNIAFANELSLICDEQQINVWELIKLANHHVRVNILNPGPGVGGHCIAVDPWFIVDSAPKLSRLIRTAREVNDSKPDMVINKVMTAITELPTETIACLGLSFKADIDDLRESPAVEIVLKLATKGIKQIFVVEPHIKSLPAKLAKFSNVTLVKLDCALSSSELLLILVDHKEFLNIQDEQLAYKKIIDTRGILRGRSGGT